LIELPVRGTLRAALPAAAVGGVSNIAGEIMSPAYHVLHMVFKCMQHLLDRVLRKIFGTKWKKETGEGRFYDDYNLQYSPHIIRVITSREMRWPEHGVRIGE
jgi:hypothetical protein